MLEVTAAILAGGLGTRLRSAVDDRPKVLADVAGRPFLTHLLDLLHDAGIRDVVLCTGFQAEQVRTTCGDVYRGMTLAYSPEAEPLGTGGALRLALPRLRSDPVLILNGDSYFEADLHDFRHFYQQRQAQAALLLAHVPDVGRFGQVRLDDRDRLCRFEEKGNCQGPGWINAGIYLLGRDLLASIPAAQFLSLEHTLFPQWLSHGFFGRRQNGRFLDIGTPESYASANAFFAGVASHPEIR